MPSVPWRSLAILSLLGTVAVVTLAMRDLTEHGGRNPVSLIQPGTEGPSRAVVEQDFPGVVLPHGLGHDGQQFYVIARAPMHLSGVASQLDRPRYRLQRPLLPWLAWAMHPGGGGPGLIWAMFAVNVTALFVAGLAGGALSVSWHGPRWIAALMPLLPAGYVSLRISVADALALALVLGALLADVRGRTTLALLAASAAVLSKESILIVLLGWALTRRSRSATIVAAAGGAVVAGWWLVLHVMVDAGASSVIEFGAPFGGLADSVQRWWTGDQLWAAAAVIGGVAAGIAALVVRRRHPLTGVIWLSLLFLVPLNFSVLGLDLNGTRAIGPLAAAALLALATPAAADDNRPNAVTPA
jgi:hypothetical protein